MINRFINKESASITSAAFIIAIATLTSKLLGVLRDSIFASRFPIGDMDIYYAAFRIPDFIYNIVVLGALSAGFIPIFARLTAQDKKEEAFQAANNILNILFVLLSFLTVFAIVLTPQITASITPGFEAERKAATIELTRIMFLSPIFLLLSSVLSGILQSYKRFLVYSLSTVVYNLGIIAGALLFSPAIGLRGLAWGVVLGAFLQFIIQVPSVRHLGFRYRLFMSATSKEVNTLLRITVPRLLTIILSQINLLVITVIASTLAAGSLAIFNFANNLQSFPLSIFAISFAIASFPALSAAGDGEHREKFTEVLLSTAKQILYFIIPLSIFLIIFRAQIVRVIYGHGGFGWNETVATIDALTIFCVSLFAQSLIPLFSRAFWAMHDSKTPFYASLFSAAFNIFLAVYLAPRFGLDGLVGAYTLSSILSACLLFVLLDRKYLDKVPRGFYVAAAQISFSGIFAGFVGYQMLYAVEPFLDTHTFLGIAVQGMLSGSAMLLVYFAWGWIFRIEEFVKFRSAFQKRALRAKIKPTELIAEE